MSKQEYGQFDEEMRRLKNMLHGVHDIREKADKAIGDIERQIGVIIGITDVLNTLAKKEKVNVQ